MWNSRCTGECNLPFYPFFFLCSILVLTTRVVPKGKKSFVRQQIESQKNVTVSRCNCALTTLLFCVAPAASPAWVALPFALHLALCPPAVCPLPWQPPPGQNTSFRCQREQDGDKDGEIRRDGRGRGEEEKGEKREKSSARGEKKK